MWAELKFHSAGNSCSYACQAKREVIVNVIRPPASAVTAPAEHIPTASESTLTRISDHPGAVPLLFLVVIVLLCSLLALVGAMLAGTVPEFMLRIAAAAIGAYVGYVLPGTLKVIFPYVEATGAIALAVLIYLVNPPRLGRRQCASVHLRHRHRLRQTRKLNPARCSAAW